MTLASNYENWVEQQAEDGIDEDSITKSEAFEAGVSCTLSYLLRSGLLSPKEISEALYKIRTGM